MNSVHLDVSRRDAFRRAREQLLQATGSETLFISAKAIEEQTHQLPGLAGQQAGTAKESNESVLPFVQIKNNHIVPLKIGHNLIGRLPDNDIVGNDAYMSRRHCAILVHSNRLCELHDLASKNGTFLNGLRIKSPTRLQSGDEIQIGEFRMIFRMEPLTKDGSFVDRSECGDQTCLLTNDSNN